MEQIELLAVISPKPGGRGEWRRKISENDWPIGKIVGWSLKKIGTAARYAG
jgi:hypothetical protein